MLLIFGQSHQKVAKYWPTIYYAKIRRDITVLINIFHNEFSIGDSKLILVEEGPILVGYLVYYFQLAKHIKSKKKKYVYIF